MIYTADFETTTDPDDCRVWAWAVCDINNPDDIIHGINLDEFMLFCEQSKNSRFLFHNLKFDAEFIINWLFRNGFEHVIDRDEVRDRTFTTLISDTGLFYSMEVYWKVNGRKKPKKAVFRDSLKVLPMSVKAVAIAFGLPISKLEINYNQYRPIGHELTSDELAYLENDVRIMALAMQQMFSANMTAMTTGANALRDFKDTLGRYEFTRLFPILDDQVDSEIRQAYKGGFTFANPRYQMQDIGAGIVLDVNSLYPSVMRFNPMPYGEPLPFDGQYKRNRLYCLYVQRLRCVFTLKPGHIPTIQIQGHRSFMPHEYLTSSGGLEVALTLTSIDEALFFEHYDVSCLEYLGGWMFKATIGLFDEYIDRWTRVKIEAGESGNKGMRQIAKLMLNSLYGKFGLNPNVRSRYPVYVNDRVHYVTGPAERRDPIYIPVAAFITAYARNKTIRAAQRLFDRFLYADTDSLHLLGQDMPQDLEIDPSALGKWSHELDFSAARYLRAKSYMERGREPGSSEPETWRVTCAGMPGACHGAVTFENFKPGSSYPGKLMPRHVPGGIILEEIYFTIKEEDK